MDSVRSHADERDWSWSDNADGAAVHADGDAGLLSESNRHAQSQRIHVV